MKIRKTKQRLSANKRPCHLEITPLVQYIFTEHTHSLTKQQFTNYSTKKKNIIRYTRRQSTGGGYTAFLAVVGKIKKSSTWNFIVKSALDFFIEIACMSGFKWQWKRVAWICWGKTLSFLYIDNRTAVPVAILRIAYHVWPQYQRACSSHFGKAAIKKSGRISKKKSTKPKKVWSDKIQ